MANFKKPGLLIKTVTILTAASLLYSNIVWAQGGSISLQRPISSLPFSTLKDTLPHLNIPENLGKVKEIWKDESVDNNKIILHIQDSHANYEAQANIAKILEHIINTSKKDLSKNIKNHYKSNGNNPPVLIAVEGAKGGIDTSMFHRIPIMEVRDMLADFFMEKGIINGVEYFDAMVRDKHRNTPFLVWGVEDKDIYRENVKYFKKVQETKGPVEEYTDKYLKDITKLIENTWTEEQRGYFSKYYKYQNDEIGLEEYAQYLNLKIQNKFQIPNFKNLANLIKIKNCINFKRIEQERMELLKGLKQKMAQEDFTGLITDGLNYQAGNKTSADYFLRLKELMNEYKISKRRYKNLGLYFRYIQAENSIDRKLLFKELRKIEHRVSNRLFNDKKSRLLFYEVYRLIILKKFTELRIYREDLEYYKRHRREFTGLPAEEGFLSSFERFCDLGIRRDHILVENMLEKMKELGTDTGVLITGGFHTDGMTELLKQDNCSYAVISPKMLNAGNKNKYIQLVLDKKSVLEKILAFTGTRLAIALALFDIPEDYLGDNAKIKEEIERKIELLKIPAVVYKMPDINKLKRLLPKKEIEIIEDIRHKGGIVTMVLKIGGEKKHIQAGPTDLIKNAEERIEFKGGITIAYAQEEKDSGLCVTGDTLLPVLRLAEEFPISNLQTNLKFQI